MEAYLKKQRVTQANVYTSSTKNIACLQLLILLRDNDSEGVCQKCYQPYLPISDNQVIF